MTVKHPCPLNLNFVANYVINDYNNLVTGALGSISVIILLLVISAILVAVIVALVVCW